MQILRMQIREERSAAAWSASVKRLYGQACVLARARKVLFGDLIGNQTPSKIDDRQTQSYRRQFLNSEQLVIKDVCSETPRSLVFR